MQDGFSFVSHCMKCKTVYGTDDMVAIGSHKGNHQLHISCAVCRQNMIISLTNRNNELHCTGVVTDLTRSDAQQLLHAEKVSADDVLSVKEALQLDKFLKIG